MSKVQIKLNYSNIGSLLKSQEMAACVGDIARERAAALGDGYETDTVTMGTRVIASIYTDTTEAARDNSRNNSLLKAVSS